MSLLNEFSWNTPLVLLYFFSQAVFLDLPQATKGYEFESDTDTEVIPKLIKYVYDNREDDGVTFSTLVERVIKQLVSSSKPTRYRNPSLQQHNI